MTADKLSAVVPSTLGSTSSASDPSSGSAPLQATEAQNRKSCLVSALLAAFTEKPTAATFALGVACFYARTILNLVVIVVALLGARWYLAITVIVGIVAPGLIHCINMYYIVKVMDSNASQKKQLYEATLALFSLNRAAEAWRYYKGKAPSMGLVIKDYLGNLTFGTLPAISGSMKELMRGAVEPGFDKNALIFHTCVCTIVASFSLKMLHTVTGPPSRMEKYRFWDLDSRPVFTVFMVQLIDASQIIYRLTLFALIGAYAGFAMECAMVFAYAFVSSGYFKVGLSLMAVYDNSSSLMSLISGIENVIYDYGWLERVPVYSFYAEASFQLRMVQLVISVFIIYTTWDNGADFDPNAVRIVLAVCAISSLLYITAYVYYVFYLMRHRVAAALVLRDEFVGNLFIKRQERLQERRQRYAVK